MYKRQAQGHRDRATDQRRQGFDPARISQIDHGGPSSPGVVIPELLYKRMKTLLVAQNPNGIGMGRSRHQGIAVVAATINLAAGIVHAQAAEGLKHGPALVVGALKRLQQCRLLLLIKRYAQPGDGISRIDDGGFVIGL